MSFFGEMAKILKSNQQCFVFVEMAIWILGPFKKVDCGVDLITGSSLKAG